MRFVAGMVVAMWIGAVSANAATDVPDSVSTCPVPAAELARARQMIASRLGADVAATCTLERSTPYVNMTDGKYTGIGGWELIARLRPVPARDVTCVLTLTSFSGAEYRLESGQLPDCAHDPGLCDIAIAREEAVERAVSRGMDRAACTADLALVDGVDGFVWRVRARPAGALHDRVVVINARTGAVAFDYDDKPCPR